MRQMRFFKFKNLVLITVFLMTFEKQVLAAPFSVKDGDYLIFDVEAHSSPLNFFYRTYSDKVSDLKFHIKNENGFECAILKHKLVNRLEYSRWPAELNYEIVIGWSPGADLSGCQILVEHADLQQNFQIDLKMNY